MASSRARVRDAIIVGAGPAGSVLGYELARAGADVVVLEKERIPRYKACGGGVNLRAARLLDFDISPVTERVVYGVEVTYKLGQGFVKRCPEPLTFMVMRDRFDCFLAERAVATGAAVLDGRKVTRIEEANRHLLVRCGEEAFQGLLIVGADGASSVVARHLGLMREAGLSVALEAEVDVPSSALARWDSLVTIDIGVIPGGYAWVFPKADHLSIGVVGDVRHVHRLRQYYRRFLQAQHLGPYQVRRFRGHRMPMRYPGMDIQQGPGLLLGDAAGLIDPFSGDGIYYAIRSAQIAAPVVLKALESGAMGLGEYQMAVDRELMPERRVAATMLRLFNWVPGLYFQWIKHHQLPWKAACKILRGDKAYTSVPQRLGPKWILFDLVRRM
ncbi:MAG: NAD(P)/FAD-dependent oxidoreductase [Dehalococcoidia bacterium]